MRRSRRRGAAQAIPEVTLTPLIDTALTLLIIFMITTPMMQHVIKVELPASKTNEKQEHTQKELVVYIDKAKKLYFNGKVYPLSGLITVLQKSVKADQDVVFVKADQAVSYGKVIELVDTLKTVGGISYVALATKQAV